jgi:hypothetical protein
MDEADADYQCGLCASDGLTCTEKTSQVATAASHRRTAHSGSLRGFPIFPGKCDPFWPRRVAAGCNVVSSIAVSYEPLFIGGDMDQLTFADTKDDPVVVLYRHVEGIERITSLGGTPVLDLIAQNELPHLAQRPLLESSPNAPVLSAIRRLGGATILDPSTPETLAQALGFAYLPLDDIAVNPEIGFLVLRTRPGKKDDAPEGQTRTLLLWEIAEDVFHGMPLLTDTAEVAARMYGERPKASPAPRPSPMAPQR